MSNVKERAERMFRCRHTTELASEYMEGGLPGMTRFRLRLHLFICGNCRRYLAQMRGLCRMLSDIGETPPPAAQQAQLLDSFRRTYRP